MKFTRFWLRRTGRAWVALGAWWLAIGLVSAESTHEEANIARVTASLLERSHFVSHRHDLDLSSRFLDRYLEMLDGAKFYFLATDVAEFEPYRRKLAELTLQAGDISPAQTIFQRYLERLDQRVEFVREELKLAPFDFSAKDEYLLDRDKAPRPADLPAAQALWRQQLRYEYLQEKLGGKKPPAEIVTTLTKRYERTLRTMKQFTADQVFEMYLTAFAHVYDPHSDYLGPRQLEEFAIAMRLSLFGIGAVLRSEDGYCKIVELLPGGPAAESKQIKPGDRIVAVAQDSQEAVDVIEMPLTDVVQLIRGPKGTKVSLTLLPADATDSSVRRLLTLVRDEIKLEKQEAKARIVDLPGVRGRKLRVGVIDLPSFYVGDDHRNGQAGATADVEKLLQKLKAEKIQGLVLDLRRNGGGSLDEAIRLSGLFIEDGPVVQTKDAEGQVTVSSDPDPTVVYDGPLVVLTSRMSASASEILAGALQDYRRALIVGDESTFGKGTVQTMIQLAPLLQKVGMPGGENPGALKLTIRKFYRPGGASTQLRGVVPDLVLPSPLAALKVGEGEMPDSLPWDEVAPATFARQDRVTPYLPALRLKSSARRARDPEFAWLDDDINRLRQRLAHPVVSLNEEQRLAEKAADEARLAARKAARAKRKPAEQTEYEITLKIAGTSGLPAPLSAAALTNSALTASSDLDEEDGEDADKTPAVDITLEETKRILADYIGLLPQRKPAAVAGRVLPAR